MDTWARPSGHRSRSCGLNAETTRVARGGRRFLREPGCAGRTRQGDRVPYTGRRCGLQCPTAASDPRIWWPNTHISRSPSGDPRRDRPKLAGWWRSPATLDSTHQSRGNRLLVHRPVDAEVLSLLEFLETGTGALAA